METNIYRIAKPSERAVAAQSVAPLTCRLLSAIEPEHVPTNFRALHSALGCTLVDLSAYVVEITTIVSRFHRKMRVESQTLDDLAKSMAETPRFAAQVFVLAYMVETADAFRALCRDATEVQRRIYLGLLRAVREDRPKALRPMQAVLSALATHEIQDRLDVVCRVLDAPFYYTHANPVVILSLAHFDPGFVRDYRACVLPFVRDVRALDRVQALVSVDHTLFCSALLRVPGRFVGSKRFELDVWGAEEPHPEAGRIMFAFASIWCVPTLITFRARWNLSPQTIRKLYDLANRGWCPKLHETTYPFGSRI